MSKRKEEVFKMTSGPALRQADSHSSIHEAAIGEAEHLTELLRMCLEKNELDKAYDTACIALEHWETRTLAHAEAEEEGLYRDIVHARPDWADSIVALTRDHELMRRLAAEIRSGLELQKVSYALLKRFESLILIDLQHNHDEEQLVAALGAFHG
jgi:hypothetical protein